MSLSGPNHGRTVPRSVENARSPFLFVSDLPGTSFVVGRRALEMRSVAIVGMSPGNPYFSSETHIQELLTACANAFARVQIFIPELPAIHTYRALDYGESKSRSKARLQANAIRNKCIRAVEQYPEMKGRVQFLELDEKSVSTPEYRAAYDRIEALYRESDAFRTDIHSAALAVLSARQKKAFTEEAISEGARFLLEELAFLDASPSLLGVCPCAYIYHRPWEIFQRWVEGQYGGVARVDLGFLICRSSM